MVFFLLRRLSSHNAPKYSRAKIILNIASNIVQLHDLSRPPESQYILDIRDYTMVSLVPVYRRPSGRMAIM